MNCEHCGVPVHHEPGGPPVTMARCSDACLDAWEEADPTRKEGWVSVVDLTPDRARELFLNSGLDLANGAGPVVKS